MRNITFFPIALAALITLITPLITPRTASADQQAAPAFVTEIPLGFRNWKAVSVAHEEGNLNSFAIILGNDTAIKAYREETRPFPNGSIIAALHYGYISSDENNKAFGRAQSFVPGPPTNIQFMVKDSVKYAATGGWGFGHFKDGVPGEAALMQTCFPCHEKAQVNDHLFTHYVP